MPVRRGFRAYDGNHAPKPPFTLNKDSPQAQGLVGWWPLSRGDLIARDLVGRHPNSTIAGDPQVVVTEFGVLGIDFDGVEDNLIIAQAEAVAAPLTLMCWYAPSSVAGAADNIFSLDDASTSDFFRLVRNDTKLQISIRESSGTIHVADSGNTFTINKFSLCVGRYNTIASRDVILDANFGNSASDTNSATPAGISTTVIGGLTGSSGDVEGILLDARVYNIAVPDAVIAAAYHPSTRWDLSWQRRRTYFLPVAAAAALDIPSLTMAPYIPA